MHPVTFLLLLSFGLFLGMVIMQEIGRRIGMRGAETQKSRAGAGVIDASVFALLGLLMAFQLSGADGRLNYRRQLAVREANAIGTAYLRLDFLPADRQSELRALFANYVDSRIAVNDSLRVRERSEAESAKATALQNEIWSKSVAAMQSVPGSPATILLTPALNEMIDITTTRHVAARTHAPLLVVGLLVALALMASLLAGLATSAAPRRITLHMVLFAAVTVSTIYVISDLEFPSIGTVRVGEADQALKDLRSGMK